LKVQTPTTTYSHVDAKDVMTGAINENLSIEKVNENSLNRDIAVKLR